MISERLAALVRAATVQLAGDAPGTGGAPGTGFFVAPGIVATCAHVVARARDRLPGTVGGRIVATRPEGTDRELVFETEAEWYLREGEDDGIDLAFLRAPAAEDVAPTLLSGVVEIGDVLWTYGHPAASRGGQSALFTAQGRSRARATGGDWEPERVVGTPIGGGYSGSPVLNSRTGAVAGMAYASDRVGSAHLVSASDIIRALRDIVRTRQTPAAPVPWLAVLDDDQIRAGGWRFPGPILRGYLDAAARAAADHPFRGQLPDIEAPPLTAVYLRQSVRRAVPGAAALVDGGAPPPAHEAADLEPSAAILDHDDDCFVVAGPGTGKSSLLRTLLITLAEQWLADAHTGSSDSVPGPRARRATGTGTRPPRPAHHARTVRMSRASSRSGWPPRTWPMPHPCPRGSR